MINPPTGEAQELPGLEAHDPDRPPGEVELAARRTIRALDDADELEERDAVVCQALVTLSRQYDQAAGSAKAKDYAIANLHAQLLATVQLLAPVAAEGGEDDEWSNLEREFLAAERERVREAAVRDAARPGSTD